MVKGHPLRPEIEGLFLNYNIMEKKVILGDLDFYQKFYLKGEVYYVCHNQTRLKQTWVIARQGGSKQLLPNETIVTIKDSSKYIDNITSINYLS